MFIRFKTGSTWQVIGSDNYDALVGTPPIGVVFSEWALSDPQAWSLIRPILLENGGWSIFITTPRGRNHAHRMYEMAKGSDEWFAEHLTADKTGVFSQQQLANEKAELIAERGETDGEAIYDQEYMCSWSAACPAPTTPARSTSWSATAASGAFRTIPAAGSHGLGPGRQRHDRHLVHPAHADGAGRSSTTSPTPRSGIDWYVREIQAGPTSTASTCCRTTATTSAWAARGRQHRRHGARWA
jgi:phage terminase large subunit